MDEGEGPPTDLEALASAVAAGSPGFSSRLADLADLAEMTRMWAVEKYISHWDGYSGEEAENKPNNYFLHSDLAGLFQMLPWGTDNTWQVERRIGFAGPGGLLFNGCLSEAECFGHYLAALQALQEQVATLNPDSLAAATAALLKPWQELEEVESTRGEHDVAEIDAAADMVHRYIEERPGELAAWLNANRPPVVPSEPVAPKTTPPPPTLTREAVVRHPHSFTLRLDASAAGRVGGQAKMRTEDGDRVVCSDRAELAAAGTVALRCDLSADAQRRLAKRWLRFAFSARLRTADGQVAELATVVRLPRG
jgi:CotH kinase protein